MIPVLARNSTVIQIRQLNLRRHQQLRFEIRIFVGLTDLLKGASTG
ncbi:MAG: hypothetical protein NTW71_11570 [Deltaproteobacteria bacterium]|nr:hypothetical protein [Deltaproteobacteria bacterium]